jgi:hypothetical protein
VKGFQGVQQNWFSVQFLKLFWHRAPEACALAPGHYERVFFLRQRSLNIGITIFCQWQDVCLGGDRVSTKVRANLACSLKLQRKQVADSSKNLLPL